MEYSRLLNRQLRKYFPHENIPKDMLAFIEAVNNSYLHAEKDRQLIERAMEISSDELMEKNKALRDSNAALDEFVYRVSHDLKVPTNNIRSMLILIERKSFINDDLGKEFMKRLVLAADTLDMTINDVLDMTRIEKLSQEKRVENNLAQILEDILLLFETNINETNTKIDIEIPTDITVYFQEENLRSIIRNLISNTLKYRDVKKQNHVKISTNLFEEYICVKIADNGIGIDLEKYGKRLYEMFSRFNSHVQGTGVGLYIVKKVIESQDGRIEVKSELGVGTTFSLYFKQRGNEKN